MGSLKEFQKSIPFHVINTVIFLLQWSLALLPAQYPRRFSALTTLTFGLYTRFYHSYNVSDLTDAISCLQDALERCADGDWQRSNTIRQIFCISAARFDFTNDALDLQKAFSLFRVANTPAASLHNRAMTLWTRYQKGHQQVDLEEAIVLLKQALNTPLDDRPMTLTTLGLALSTRAKQEDHRMDSDIDEAISLHRQALELLLPSHPTRSHPLNNLGVAFYIRFEKGGQQMDLDEAISLFKKALEFYPPTLHDSEQPVLLNLACALSTRFKRTGQRADVDEAISLNRHALELLPSHPQRSTFVNHLAEALFHRFYQGGQQIDIDEAISLDRHAVTLDYSPHPHQLNLLARSLALRRQGVDLEEAISLFRQNLETDLDRSLSLSNLAATLSIRFHQELQQADIDEAIYLHRQAFALLSPTHPQKSTCLKHLAGALHARFNKTGQENDLDEAISLMRQLRPLSSELLPQQAASFHNLASVLACRFRQRGQQTDFDEALSLFRQTLKLQTSYFGDSHRSATLTALGGLLIQAYSHSLSGRNSEYLDQAMSSFFAATRFSRSVFDRLACAKTWIRYANKYQHPSVLNAYEAALQALPQVAALSLDIKSRQEALSTCSDGVARGAARSAIRAGKLEKAIEFLEAGRSVFWSQVLSLRSPINQLRDIAPELADKLQDIGTALELGAHRNVSTDMSDYRKNLSIEQETSRLNRLNEEWANTIDEVRKVVGLEDFLRPRRFSALRAAASTSPVVVLVANDDGSDCLILTSTTIHHIGLPSLHTLMLQELVRLVRIAVSPSNVSRSSIDIIVENISAFLGQNRGGKVVDDIDDKWGSSDDIFRHVLRILWDNLVNPVISLLEIQVSCSICGDLSRHSLGS